MRWVVVTPLGMRVEPEVNRIFTTVSGPTLVWAASRPGPGSVCSRVWKLCRRPLPSNVAVAEGRSSGPSPASPSVITTGVLAGITASMARW